MNEGNEFLLVGDRTRMVRAQISNCEGYNTLLCNAVEEEGEESVASRNSDGRRREKPQLWFSGGNREGEIEARQGKRKFSAVKVITKQKPQQHVNRNDETLINFTNH